MLRIFLAMEGHSHPEYTLTHTSSPSTRSEVSRSTWAICEVFPPTGTTRRASGTTKSHSTTGSSHTLPAHESLASLVSASGRRSKFNKNTKQIKSLSSLVLLRVRYFFFSVVINYSLNYYRVKINPSFFSLLLP